MKVFPWNKSYSQDANGRLTDTRILISPLPNDEACMCSHYQTLKDAELLLQKFGVRTKPSRLLGAAVPSSSAPTAITCLREQCFWVCW